MQNETGAYKPGLYRNVAGIQPVKSSPLLPRDSSQTGSHCLAICVMSMRMLLFF